MAINADWVHKRGCGSESQEMQETRKARSSLGTSVRNALSGKWNTGCGQCGWSMRVVNAGCVLNAGCFLNAGVCPSMPVYVPLSSMPVYVPLSLNAGCGVHNAGCGVHNAVSGVHNAVSGLHCVSNAGCGP